ncbi:DUF559 domain-containing protein [Sinomonas atrocyanea]|uniref:DUF559 domain-containing protein n=1 Tax=Sinomonas atrocyanea TaxID=37927 RepID=UPI003D952E79
MTARDDLPADLHDRAFTFGAARQAGVSVSRLRAHDLERWSRGIYGPAGREVSLRERAEVHLAATADAWVSHRTAAALQGMFLPPWVDDHAQIHLSKPSHLPRARRKGVAGHRVRIRPGELHHVDGLLMTTPARTWLDLAVELGEEFRVALGDQLIRRPRPGLEKGREKPLATTSELRELLDAHVWMKGVGLARAALEHMRVGADSVPESLLRQAIAAAGLPEPELQISLVPLDPYSPSGDMGYPRIKLVIQYEGAHHDDEAQRLRDARRDRAFRDAGWTVLLVRLEDLRDGFRAVIREIRGYLAAAAA